MDTPQPPHPLGALTTSGSHPLPAPVSNTPSTASPPDAPIQADLRRKLGEVLAEQQSRASIAASIARTDP